MVKRTKKRTVRHLASDQTFHGFALSICKAEGLKKQVDYAQVLEILGHVADAVYHDVSVSFKPWILQMLHETGKKRWAERVAKS